MNYRASRSDLILVDCSKSLGKFSFKYCLASSMRPDCILYLRIPRSLRNTELSGLKSFSFFLMTWSLTIGGLNRLSLL